MASVKVAVRARPLNQREIDLQSKPIIEMCGNKTTILNVKLPSSLTDHYSDSGRERVKEFTYDYSYWSCSPNDPHFVAQETVFDDLGREVVENAFIGYNACIFAYGQTGSGKTYTMMGSQEAEGLIPRICQSLFDRMKVDSKSGTTFRTEVSYLEIYNERVKDLLRKNAQHNLKVREHPKLGPYVQELSRHFVMDYSDVQELMKRGNSHRTTAATAMNDVSSRSHAIFTLTFVQAKFDQDMPSETVSKVNLVDLAGSERANASGATGQRLKEGGHINKSLVTLGSVISALADMSGSTTKKAFFIPYRDSVLTWLLKDSLGGNSKTIMIATISPAECNYGESLSTLRYASRAKSIINRPTINEDANVKLIRELRDEIAHLRSMLGGSVNDSPNVMEKLQMNEARVKVLTEEWTEKWREIQKILQEQRTLGLRKAGAGVVLDSAQPHLIGLDDDVLSTGITLYHLKEGCTTVGTCESENKMDIELTGMGIEKEHCLIELKNGITTLIPLRNSHCSVNTIVVDSPTRLSQGCVILLGATNMFRFNDPAEAQRLRKDRGRGSNWSLPRLSMMSRSVSDLAKSMENLNSSGFSLDAYGEKELQLLEAKKKQIEELEAEHCQAEERRMKEQVDFQREMESKRKQLEELREEALKMQKEAEEVQKINAEEQKRLNRRSLDVERQFQDYMQQKQKLEESINQQRVSQKEDEDPLKNGAMSPDFKNPHEHVLSWLQKRESSHSLSSDEAMVEKRRDEDDRIMQVSETLFWVKSFLDTLPSRELAEDLEYRLQTEQLTENLVNELCEGMCADIAHLRHQLSKSGSDLETTNNMKDLELRKEQLDQSRTLLLELVKQKHIPEVTPEESKVKRRRSSLNDSRTNREETWGSPNGRDCRLWSAKSVQNLENLILRSAETIREDANAENRIRQLHELECRFREIEEDMEERLLVLEDERGRELDAIELEKFRLEEMQEQERINDLVEWEVQRRLHNEQKRNIISSKMSVHSDDEGNPVSSRWCRYSDIERRESFDHRSEPVNSHSLMSRLTQSYPGSLHSDTLALGEFVPFQILIPSYVIRGSGTSSHYEYEVKIWTSDDHWTLYRRYKRFRELHKLMHYKYGRMVKMPYFPPKKIFGSRSENVVQERRKHLEVYLQDLIAVLRKIPGNPISLPSGNVTSILRRKELCELSSFFQKGCFETTRHGTG